MAYNLPWLVSAERERGEKQKEFSTDVKKHNSKNTKLQIFRSFYFNYLKLSLSLKRGINHQNNFH